MTSTSVLIDAFSLERNECAVVANKVVDFFRSRPYEPPPRPNLDLLKNLDASWDVAIGFSTGHEMHRFVIEARGESLQGVHIGGSFKAPMAVRAHADWIELTSKVPFEGIHLFYRFIGKPAPEGLSGSVTMGAAGSNNSGPVGAAQFGAVPWRATRVDPKR